MAIKVAIVVVTNKWFFMHNGTSMIGIPMYADGNTSAIMPDGYFVEEFDDKDSMTSRLDELGYEWEEQA